MATRKWLVRTCVGGLLAVGSFLAAAYVAAPPKKIAPPLPALNVDPMQLTLAGNSSGGFMAIQAEVAYSGTFHGVAAMGSAPFYCSEGHLLTMLNRCIGKISSGVPTEKLVGITKRWAEEGKIDPLRNIAAHKIYVFRGTLDTIIPTDVAQSVADFYSHFAPPSNIIVNFRLPVAHGWVSPYGTNSCASETENYINNCRQFDAAREFLTAFYGALQPKNEHPSGALVEFDQNEFFDDKKADAHSVDDTGYAYIPAVCAKHEVCRAVIALHACDQDYGKVEKIFIDQSGINQWADTNRIVVVYPQVKASNFMLNPRGCWDTIGYDGDDFAWKSGRQLKMLKRIADRITAKYRTS
jgi:hypothetical protein